MIEKVDWKKIIDLSCEIDDCGFIPETHSSQKEFVFDEKFFVFLLRMFFCLLLIFI